LIILALAVLGLVAGQDTSSAQYGAAKESFSPAGSRYQDRQAQAQVQTAERRINANKRLAAQLAELAQRNDTAGIRRILIANGLPSNAQISNVNVLAARTRPTGPSSGPSQKVKVTIRCTFHPLQCEIIITL
jgi:hypothetical protein